MAQGARATSPFCFVQLQCSQLVLPVLMCHSTSQTSSNKLLFAQFIKPAVSLCNCQPRQWSTFVRQDWRVPVTTLTDCSLFHLQLGARNFRLAYSFSLKAEKMDLIRLNHFFHSSDEYTCLVWLMNKEKTTRNFCWRSHALRRTG